MPGIVIFTVEPSRVIVVAKGGDGWSTMWSVAISLSFSSAILNTMRTFCWPACNVPCQLPVIFWACNALPSNAAKAIIHKVNFFIGDLLFPALINMMSRTRWRNNGVPRRNTQGKEALTQQHPAILNLMHEMAVFWLRMATALYGVGLLHVMAVLLRRREGFLKPALFAFLIAAVLHFVAIVELSVAIGHLPVDTFFESATVCAFLIAVLFLFVYWRYDAASLSVCIFPLVFVLTQVGAMESPMLGLAQHQRPRSAAGARHDGAARLCPLLLTAVASLFYLIQERQLKRKKPLDLPEYFAQLFKRLPPLATLDNLITNAMSFGFVFITLGVIAGSTWAFIDAGTAWIRDPRIALAFITWGFYLTMVFLRQPRDGEAAKLL